MSKSIYEKFKTNRKAEQEGIILDYGDGQTIRIARAGGSNIRFEKSVQQKMRKFGLQAKHELLEPEQMRSIFREVVAETVILEWTGFTDEEGNNLPLTRENAIKVFTDLPDLFDDILEQSRKASLFKDSILENEAKN